MWKRCLGIFYNVHLSTRFTMACFFIHFDLCRPIILLSLSGTRFCGLSQFYGRNFADFFAILSYSI